MFKKAVPIANEIKPTQSKSIRPRIIFVVSVVVILVPLAAEGAAICYAQWRGIMGKSTEARTPILDSMGSGFQHARDLLADSLGSPFHGAIHDPNLALPVAAGFLVVAMAMLRR
jgi:hypothetical protein